MNFKRFFYRFILFSVVLYSAIFIFVNFIVDPDMETRLTHFGFNKYKFSHSPLASTFLYEKLKTGKYSLVFGTSRSHQITGDDLGEPTLNFHAIYGSPYAVKSFLDQLDETQIKNISTIYYLIDDLTFNRKKNFEYINYRSSLFYYFKLLESTNFDKILKAFDTIRENGKPIRHYIDENGAHFVSQEPSTFDPMANGSLEPVEIIQNRQIFTEDTFPVLNSIYTFCQSHGIKIVFFTAPLPVPYLKQISYDLFVGERDRFLNNIPGYYELAFVKGLSDDNSLFSDSTHTNSKGKDILIKILKTEDKNYYMTKENFETYKETIKNL